jgi:AcrR family transcriptional regulator
MADPLTPRAREIVNTARELLDEHGTDALTMRRLAERLGIRAPSLYKHVPDKATLEVAIIATGLEDLAAALETAADTAAESLAVLAQAYRAFARAHPHLYLLMTNRPLPRHRLPAGVEDRAAAPVLRATGDPAQARAFWAFGHGMVTLELAGRFPPDADLDAAWQAGVTSFGRPHGPNRCDKCSTAQT